MRKMFCQFSLSYNKFVQRIYSFDILIGHKRIQKSNKNGMFCAISIAVERFGNKIFNQWKFRDKKSIIHSS